MYHVQAGIITRHPIHNVLFHDVGAFRSFMPDSNGDMEMLAMTCKFAPFRAHLERLGESGQHARFNAAVSARFLDDYVHSCMAEGVVVLGYWRNGLMRGAGELHSMASGEFDDRMSAEAEFALSVEPVMQKHGIGTLLLDQLISIAPQHGYCRLIFTTQSYNAAMQSLALHYCSCLKHTGCEISGSIDINA